MALFIMRLTKLLVKYLTIILILLVFLFVFDFKVYATETENPEEAEDVRLDITSRAAIVIDYNTGEELYNHNADTRRNPASMTKMMTVYLVYEAIARGDIGFDTIVPISASAAQFSLNPNETNVPLSRSATYTVDELLDAVIVVSAGGATRALAELVGGSRNDFIMMMNNKAAEWGIEAYYANESGGPRRAYITPRAMAELTRITLNDFPEVLKKTALPSIVFGGRTYESTNMLLNVYDGIDGFKTGTNSNAGACFAATAARGDTRIISVTMGSTYNGRFPDSAILLDHGFTVMEQYHIEQSKISPKEIAVDLEGEVIKLRVFTIDHYEYFNIRDLAYILKETSARFDVQSSPDVKEIEIITGAQYVITGSELAELSDDRYLPVLSETSIVVDGNTASMTVYEIDNGLYFRLDDISELCGITTDWDNSRVVVMIEVIAMEEPPAEIEAAPTPSVTPVHTVEQDENPPVSDTQENQNNRPLLVIMSVAAVIIAVMGIVLIIHGRRKPV